MPYISEPARSALDAGDEAAHPGELNYLFSKSINRYILSHGLSYQTINDILGALEGAKQEFYLRVARPYEKKKRNLNGDVYG